jgi:hypothetical protein
MVVDFTTDEDGEIKGQVVCGKAALRYVANQPEDGCCENCFGAMLKSGDFSATELAHDYPMSKS